MILAADPFYHADLDFLIHLYFCLSHLQAVFHFAFYHPGMENDSLATAIAVCVEHQLEYDALLEEGCSREEGVFEAVG